MTMTDLISTPFSIRAAALTLLLLPMACGGEISGNTDSSASPDVETSDPCRGIPCSGHGVCAVAQRAPLCACFEGYHPRGLDCVSNSEVDAGGPAADAGLTDAGFFDASSAADAEVRRDAAPSADAEAPADAGGGDSGDFPDALIAPDALSAPDALPLPDATPPPDASAPADAGASPDAGAPRVLYTDILSGPSVGGENNKGVYLSIFGVGFGNTGLGARLKVFIGGVEVDNYRTLGPSRGRPDIQQITVQIGALGGPSPGQPLPIRVDVDGVSSNTDHTFTVNPGRLLFVDNVVGNDATAVVGDVMHPFRHAQTSNLSAGAWGQVAPGDFIVLRGTGTPWRDTGYEGYFLRYRNKSGSAPTGAVGTGPIAIIGYPGEDVFIEQTPDINPNGGITAINGSNYTGMGQWAVVANLRIQGDGYDGPISHEIYGHHWRVVNNDLSAPRANEVGSRGAGITGNGVGEFWVGNHIHDISGGAGLENHGIYIDGAGSYEIAYNLIERISGGSGIQVYVNGGNGSDYLDDQNVPFAPYTSALRIHHNTVHDVAKYLINLADGSRSGIAVYNNVAYNGAWASLRFNTNTLSGCRIFNNTFYNSPTDGRAVHGAIMNDWGFPADALDLENNIFVAHPGAAYDSGSVGLSTGIGIIRNNLYFGGTGSVSFDSQPISGDPRFVSAGSDFHLQAGSPALDSGSSTVQPVVGDDYDATTARPRGAGFDLGAYER